MDRKERIRREAMRDLGIDGEVEQEVAPPRFSDEQLAAERVAERAGVNQPGFRGLVDHMKRFGPDGVLESAVHLPEEQYDKLAEQAKRMRYNRKARRWETS